ncbi:MAG TPA: FAD binding domain-containing protein [Rectinemataceae bacterium]|nr:FAD binding domain-containing protein [Rectinemataceae bacterium]
MTLGTFEHIAARDLDEAQSAAKGGRAVFTAGGTDLLGILKDRVHRAYPARVVDLKPLRELAFVREEGGGLAIGAMTSLADIAADPLVLGRFGLLAEAARSVASPQIRNMATIGGNLCQEPRCWYYRHPENRFDCLRKGGRACAALLGENRFHSIFGAARVGKPSCSDDCPDGVDIPAYMEYVRSGDLDGAARILLLRNPMPAITGRVCPHYCERGCNRQFFDESVSIRAVERRLGDRVLEVSDTLYDMPSTFSGKRVAVVGSGPAGLAAAFYLRKAGHAVRVFERMPEAGGMLRYSIPAYRLPRAVFRSLLSSYERAGIEFELGADIGGGGHRSVEALRRDYDAVFLGSGAWEQKTLSIQGSELLESGLDFLASAGGPTGAPSADNAGEGAKAAVVGKEIVVVGGGNVAVDVAITARRLGARKVTMLCLENRGEMPAFPEEIEEALREGVGLLPSWGPKRSIVEGGRLAGMEFVACNSVFDSQGRFAPSFDESRTTRIEADRVILAIGQSAELGYLGGLLASERGRIAADPLTQATSLDGLYAGGDATTGPSSVIQAVATGRRAAESIGATFGGDGSPGVGAASEGTADNDGSAIRSLRGPSLEHSGRVLIPGLPLGERSLETEDAATIGADESSREAGRCLDCSCVAVNASDMAPALLALGATVRTTRRRLDAEDFFAVRRASTTRLERGEILTEIRVPPQREGSRFSFLKFRIRNSIDFPIVSVASIFSLEGGRIAEARMAFGAVAPLPMRAREVESFLVGRLPDEETAREAGELATRLAVPLEHNAYKLQILKGLVRKAVLGLR